VIIQLLGITLLLYLIVAALVAWCFCTSITAIMDRIVGVR